MEVRLLIEEGASKADIKKARNFRDRFKSPEGDRNVYSMMKEVEKDFPDSSYNGMRVVICVPTAMDLASPKGMKAAARILKSAQKEIGT